MSPRILPLLLSALVGGCVQSPGLGPDLGDCADYPEGVYAYGEIGIGTCLAGPADISFFNAAGRTWMSVVNTNPFRLFDSGSVLFIPWDRFVDDIDARYRMDELEAYALPIDSFAGRFAFDTRNQIGMVPGRLSAESFTETAEDRVWLLDLADPTNPGFVAERRAIGVRQDPYALAYDRIQQRTYVANSLDHSVSILDNRTRPPTLLDPAPQYILTEPEFLDLDSSGSSAELRIVVDEGEEVTITDKWSATWLEGTVRAWLPNGPNQRRWSSNGGSTWVPSGEPVDMRASSLINEEDPEVRAPWLGLRGELVGMWFEDQNRILSAITDGTPGGWLVDDIPAMSSEVGFMFDLGGPAVITVNERSIMYFDGTDEVGDSVIGLSTTIDGIRFNAAEQPIIDIRDAETLAPFDSVQDPSPLYDRLHDRVRMWMGVFDAETERWVIGHSQSPDGGDTFSEPEIVLDLGVVSAAAPAVRYSGGLYRMVLSLHDGTGWQFAESVSTDGFDWSDPVVFADEEYGAEELPSPIDNPPRVGLFSDTTQGWRLEGEQVGELVQRVSAGVDVIVAAANMTLSAAGGHIIGTTPFGSSSALGIEPTSTIDALGYRVLYATVTGDDERNRLAALIDLNGKWSTSRLDLIPEGEGGNVSGAQSPLVYQVDGAYHMLYAARTGEAWIMRHATSANGLDWTPDTTLPLNAPPWASLEQLPHSIEFFTDDDGQEALRLWYTGNDGSRYRIGSATSTDGVSFAPDLRPGQTAWQLGLGRPGEFDDSGVRSPAVATIDGETVLFYSGFDGDVWRVGSARRAADDEDWVRNRSTIDGEVHPVMPVLPGGFAAGSVRSIVLDPSAPGLSGFFGGFDGAVWRVGSFHGEADGLYPELKVPTSGDRIEWTTRRGQPGRSTIRLGQTIEGITLPGATGLVPDGPTSVIVDAARGFLFVAGKSANGVWVVDIRDDSTDDFDDLNYLDLETFIRVDTTTGLLGVHDMVMSGNLLYLSTREPDGIAVVDTSDVVDNTLKEFTEGSVQGVLSIRDLTDDAGDRTFAAVGAAGLTQVGNLLIVTHFRDNSISVFDLTLGPYGEEVRYIRFVGENPHVVQADPSGEFAVIANYLGAVTDDETGSSLAFLDLRPDSPTYLEITKRVVNR